MRNSLLLFLSVVLLSASIASCHRLKASPSLKHLKKGSLLQEAKSDECKCGQLQAHMGSNCDCATGLSMSLEESVTGTNLLERSNRGWFDSVYNSVYDYLYPSTPAPKPAPKPEPEPEIVETEGGDVEVELPGEGETSTKHTKRRQLSGIGQYCEDVEVCKTISRRRVCNIQTVCQDAVPSEETS